MVGTKHDDQPERISDWTKHLLDSDLVHLIRTIDWSRTEIGPLHQWPDHLRLWTGQTLADSRAACLYWGETYTAIYNEAFVPHAGKLHPKLMGSRFVDVFPELIEQIVPLFRKARETRKAVSLTEFPLMVVRNGFPEECFFSGNFTPLFDLDGQYAGCYNAVFEETRTVLNDRRRRMLNQIGTSTVPLTMTTVWSHITQALATNSLDLPLVLLYQIAEEAQFGNHRLKLRGRIGVPDHHRSAVQEADLNDDIGMMPLLRESQSKILIRPFDAHMFEDTAEWLGHGVPPEHIAAVPLLNAGSLYGYLIIGCNPQRPMDDDWQQFLTDLSQRLASFIASTSSAEESVKREQRLQAQLKDTEQRVRFMAQHADIAMQQLSLERKTIWANRHYQIIAGEQFHQTSDTLFEDIFLAADRDKAYATWQQALQGHKTQTVELRMQRMYKPPYGEPLPVTILLSAFPYLVHGDVKFIMACMTEVSRLKWAESWQARIAQEAREAKTQQSQFTDAISHEVRNPLSAILQLADSIVNSIAEWQKEPSFAHTNVEQILDDNIEAAKTILLCANHQKRIVDDVLTLSKMDFTSMTLTPATISPKELVSHAVRILDAELQAGGIRADIVEKASITELGVHQVICDSLRLTQILINLLSNAIKFTKQEKQRQITISYGVSSTEPKRDFTQQFRWTSEGQSTAEDSINGREWGKGLPLYLIFEVQDTGAGMNDEQLGRVFDRFEQATPQTSIKYGGSGLGLFICRKLAEKQNGRIGIMSEVGKGTTLGFYVKTRRAQFGDAKTEGVELSTMMADSSSVVQRPNGHPATTEKGPSHEHNLPLPHSAHSPPHLGQGQNSTIASSAKPFLYHVLLAEDNVVNQKVLRKQLERAGCVVHVANNGLEALSILPSTVWWRGLGQGSNGLEPRSLPVPLDVILMDINMPVMDGLACSSEIRSLERSGRLQGHIEIIAVTANVRQEHIDMANAAGVDAVLHKPFVVSDLLELIGKRLAGRQRSLHELLDV